MSCSLATWPGGLPSRQGGVTLSTEDLDIVQSLDEAVAAVFFLMLGRSCTPQSQPPVIAAGLSASVRFLGSVRGVCTIHVDCSMARKLADDLMGLSEDETIKTSGEMNLDPSLLRDTVGEICNMIAGSWKSRLSADFSTCALSSPVVTFNPEPRTLFASHSVFDHTLVRSYKFEDHSMTLELSLDGWER